MKTPQFNRDLIRAAVKTARKQDPMVIGYCPLENTPFKVRVESVRLRPTGGHCRAFAYWYSLVDNSNAIVFGAIDRADTFVRQSSMWLAFRLMDGALLQLYVAHGWAAAKDEMEWRKNNPLAVAQ